MQYTVGLLNQSIKQSIERSNNQSPNQSVNQSTSTQSINQSVDGTKDRTVNRSINQSIELPNYPSIAQNWKFLFFGLGWLTCVQAKHHLDDKVIQLAWVEDAGNQHDQTALSGMCHGICTAHVERTKDRRGHVENALHVVEYLHRQLETAPKRHIHDQISTNEDHVDWFLLQTCRTSCWRHLQRSAPIHHWWSVDFRGTGDSDEA